MTIKNGLSQLKDIFKKKDFHEEVEFETEMLALTFLSEIEKEAELQGIKRKELAEMVGTSASYITQIMRGNKVPNLKILTALGLALGKKFDVRAVSCVQESRKTVVFSYEDYTLNLNYIPPEKQYLELLSEPEHCNYASPANTKFKEESTCKSDETTDWKLCA